MTINLTRLYTGSQPFADGLIKIDIPFTGNILAIELTTKPEYANTNQRIGTLFQFYGTASKAYALFSGKDIVKLELPETDKLWFAPTPFLSDIYTLTIDFTNVGSVIDGSNALSLPEQILELPELYNLVQNKLDSLDSRIDILESDVAIAVAWGDITDKPLVFAPDAHNHVIADVIGLQTNLDSLDSRIDTLETASPVTNSASSLYTLVSANQTLEANKKYLATATGLTLLLPSSPSIGDVLMVSTGNFDTKVYQNTSQQVLNLATQTPSGDGNGLILKPYSSIDLIYLASGLWVSRFRARTVNNWLAPQSESTPVLKSYTVSLFNSATFEDGTNIQNINNNLLNTGNGNGDGMNSNSTIVQGLVTFSESILLDSFDFYNGQGYYSAGYATPDYRTSIVNVYSGNNLSNLIGTFNPIVTNGVKQTFNLPAPNEKYSNYIFEFIRTGGTSVGVLELDIFGRTSVDGEVLAT
ncbi:hypothetical protein HCU40_16770 [Pseudanabaena biceps]|nr:hypothetical protein [Pseudanabaena biceps]